MIAHRARRDVIVGVVLLALGIGYGALTASLPNRSLPNTPGPAFFPWLITAAIIVLSIALLLRAFGDADPEPSRTTPDSDAKLRLFTLLWIVVYVVVLPFAGFLLVSVPFFGGMMWFYGERRPVVILLASIMIPGGLLYVFRYVFQILLPAGI